MKRQRKIGLRTETGTEIEAGRDIETRKEGREKQGQKKRQR